MARNTIGFFNQLRTREAVNLGEGTQVARIENTVIIDYQSFGKGLNVSVPASRLPDGYTPFIQNFDIDDGDRLVRVPGVVQEESFVVAGRTPKEMFVQGNPNTGLAELVFIDGQWLGVRGPSGLPTTWVNAGLPAGQVGWAAATHGDLLILSNGGGSSAFYKQPLATAVIALPWGPARTLMSFAGRVFAGGVTDTGSYVPMGVTWTGASSEPDDIGIGSGFEELLDDTANGDQIIAMRSINFDIAAILTRNAVWVAQRTGDSNRPADFSVRAVGFGAITNTACVRVPGGVAYLSNSDLIVFDGNTPRSISVPINRLLYPLETNKLDRYSLNFVESRNVLQVTTPNEVFEYSFRFQRWTRNTIQALRVVNTGTQFDSLMGMSVGSGGAGGWGNDWGFSWGRTSDTGGGTGTGARPLDTTIYLNGQVIGREDASVQSFFMQPFISIIDTNMQQAQSLDTMVGIKRLILEYTGDGGTLQWSIPNTKGVFELIRTVALAATQMPLVVNFLTRKAGKGVGLRLTLTTGAIAIGRIQAEVEMRSLDRKGGVR